MSGTFFFKQKNHHSLNLQEKCQDKKRKWGEQGRTLEAVKLTTVIWEEEEEEEERRQLSLSHLSKCLSLPLSLC